MTTRRSKPSRKSSNHSVAKNLNSKSTKIIDGRVLRALLKYAVLATMGRDRRGTVEGSENSDGVFNESAHPFVFQTKAHNQPQPRRIYARRASRCHRNHRVTDLNSPPSPRQSAGEGGSEVACASNLRQMGIAYDDVLPMSASTIPGARLCGMQRHATLRSGLHAYAGHARASRLPTGGGTTGGSGLEKSFLVPSEQFGTAASGRSSSGTPGGLYAAAPTTSGYGYGTGELYPSLS